MAAPIIVLIPSHNRTDLLARTPASMAKCELPQRYREVIVVENGGKFGGEQVVAEADAKLHARYVYVEQGNKSLALNTALETIAPGTLIIFVDDDVRFRTDFLTVFDEATRDVERGWMYGGTVEIDYENEPPPDWVRHRFPPSVIGYKPYDEPTEMTSRRGSTTGCLGANFAAFIDDLRDAGGFDTSRGPGTAGTGQESEMQYRLLGRGVRLKFLPDAVVWHYVPADRSTLAWLLNRASRRGYAEGLEIAREHKGAKLCGIPLAIWKLLAQRVVQCPVAMFWPSRDKRFGGRYRWQQAVGQLKGARAFVAEQDDAS